ncbi:MAG TPA: hypothetical protein VGF55_13230 [Gemmataceae bacterium]|jgi:uncharacterized protein with von Willebrand factor type A (vWA) domain
MTKVELRKLLDLGGMEAPPPSDPSAVVVTERATSKEPASPTALELDDWALRRGRDLLAASERLQALDVGEHAVADFHACAFEPDPKLLDACADERRHEFVRQLLDTPEYRSLHTSTMLNPVASEIAAAAFAEQFADLKENEKEEDPKDADPADGEMATLRAVGRALARAGEEVGEMKETAAALGLGPGLPGSNDPKAIAALFRRVRNDTTLRRICELAGRYRRLAQSRQRRKLVHGSDDMVGVVLDGDVGRLLPHELAKLVMPDLEDDVLRRLVERQCMCREYRSSEPVAKGPIVVCVDESGSMQGENAHTAKALALALAWVARQQKRWVALVAYSGDSGERLLALPPGRWDEAALMDWLSEFIGRGSDLDVPVRELPRYYEELQAPRGVTDVLFLTDAKCRIPADVRDGFLGWKRAATARLISLVIANDPGDLTEVSDETHRVESLAVTEEAVGKALSV